MDKRNSLSEEEAYVIINKGTERPFTGAYTDTFDAGIYICRQCDAPLYYAEDKFHSGCGWPSFDDEVPHMVKNVLDKDGHRTEIVCKNCDGHLGHVFEGERFTSKNTRHCVNSISLKFLPISESNYERAIFAFGCFWGKEYLMMQQKGVITTRAVFIGGKIKTPTYREVSSGKTGHCEAVEVLFDNTVTSFETLAKLFFESHDPSVESRQNGTDDEKNTGKYRSAVFYTNLKQKEVIEKLAKKLKEDGLEVQTQLEVFTELFPAENQHQQYYKKLDKKPENVYHQKRF